MNLQLLKVRPRISLEMIDFQNDSFGADLEAIVAVIQRKIVDNVITSDAQLEDSEEIQKATNTIFKRLGLRVKFICNGPLAAILPFYSNKNHIFIHEFFRGNFNIKDQQKVINQANGKKGTVNIQNATVSGVFSEYENHLFINFYEMFKTFKLSVPEVVAVILHELGHAFYVCEYTDRLETNNQVLQAVAHEIISKKEKGDRVYIFRELKAVNVETTEAEVDKLLDGNRIIAGVTWFKLVVGSVSSQMSNTKYSDTSFENLADNFTARFKYTRQLVVALDKLNLYHDSMEKSSSMITIQKMMDVLFFVALATFAVAGIMISLPMSLFGSLLVFVTLRMSGEDVKDYTYDELKIRYKRVRNEYIEFLKNSKLSIESTRNIVDDINTIDKIITETHRYAHPLSFISNFIFTSAREAKASITEQQMLEELSMNDLFLLSSQLRIVSNKD